MKAFTQRELAQARAYAAAGGQALCTPDALVTGSGCVAYLLDQDYARLIATAQRLGARNAAPHHCGMPSQGVELRGRPLRRAVEVVAATEERARRTEARAQRLRASCLVGFTDLEDLRKI